jgi:uncharacterized protein
MPIIERYAPNVKIILYGSRARKDFKGGSDIDVALDAGKRLEGGIMANILADMEESALPICYDIVDFHELSAQMRSEILKDGVIWKK